MMCNGGCGICSILPVMVLNADINNQSLLFPMSSDALQHPSACIS